MESRSIFRGIFWTAIALLLVAHVGGGWYYSNQVIDEGFVPDPDPIVTPSGDYELVEVSYETPLGQMEAWHLPADGTTWVIHVHGLGATPAEAEHLFVHFRKPATRSSPLPIGTTRASLSIRAATTATE